MCVCGRERGEGWKERVEVVSSNSLIHWCVCVCVRACVLACGRERGEGWKERVEVVSSNSLIHSPESVRGNFQ